MSDSFIGIIVLFIFVFVALIVLWPARLLVHGYRVRNDYKTACFVAQLTAFIGWVLVIFGSVGIAVVIFRPLGWLLLVPTQVRDSDIIVILTNPLLIYGAFGILILGLSLVMAGQTARAVFDGTNYTRALLEVTIRDRSKTS